MLPLGTEESTTWILLVPRGSHAVLSGPRARDLATQLAALQKDTCWGDRIAVETFVDDADREAAFAETGSLVLFVDLEHQGPVDAELASTIARVSLADNEQPPADVEINEATVTIRSLDRRFDANGLGPSSVELLNLTEEPLEERHEEFPQGDFPLAAELPHQSGVIVRLLTAEPRIDGLLEPIEAKRARRAVELITYLCLHRPDAVTGDRLRGRVLGSSSEDAASKTLFNVVSAARRALGLDDDGSPLLPPAGRTGLYRISEEVLCDVDLLRWHLNQARSIDDDELLAIGHLRAGLDLIEYEPMATVLAGYEWLSIEGHRARFEADIEELAELLVYKALDAGYLTLAKRSLQRARLCIHFSEPLAVAAMEVAAAERDRAGLVHAFGEIRRLTDELDPGCSPPVAIERRFAELLESLREGDQASLAAMDAAPLSTSPSAPAAL
jgi:DNA-binding SARP family transcriptional activator